MITITESGMTFGPYSEPCVYHLECSSLYKSVKNVKTVEFILQDKAKSLSFVEAKSSSPKPEPANNTNFDEFIEEIRNKFLHSLNLYYAAILRRHEKTADIPTDFQNLNNEDICIKLVLVIKDHQFAWLAPIHEALCRALIPYESIWHFDIAVINDEMALKYGLIN